MSSIFSRISSLGRFYNLILTKSRNPTGAVLSSLNPFFTRSPLKLIQFYHSSTAYLGRDQREVRKWYEGNRTRYGRMSRMTEQSDPDLIRLSERLHAEAVRAGQEAGADLRANSVYLSIQHSMVGSRDNYTTYVGISSDLSRRRASHIDNSGRFIVEISAGRSRIEARAIEQYLIEAFRYEQDANSQNIANSISQRNGDLYHAAQQYAHRWFSLNYGRIQNIFGTANIDRLWPQLEFSDEDE